MKVFGIEFEQSGRMLISFNLEFEGKVLRLKERVSIRKGILQVDRDGLLVNNPDIAKVFHDYELFKSLPVLDMVEENGQVVLNSMVAWEYYDKFTNIHHFFDSTKDYKSKNPLYLKALSQYSGSSISGLLNSIIRQAREDVKKVVN